MNGTLISSAAAEQYIVEVESVHKNKPRKRFDEDKS